MIESPFRIAIARGSCRTPLTARTPGRLGIKVAVNARVASDRLCRGSNQGIGDSDIIEMMRRLR